ncbi:MAG: hypothetical protein LBI79_03805 [Nitrososphaerota archaeon]|jgi:predicted CopG family antitoxin|nr:hypothetical protein [Nitrososphaerota archaeon]
MPASGFKNITVTQEVYTKLEIMAKNDKRSIGKEVEHLLESAKKQNLSVED